MHCPEIVLRRLRLLLSAFAATLAGGVQAGGIPTLDEVVVTGSTHDLVGIAASASEGTVTARQLETRPLLRPGEVLEVVPGLIVSQHSGDGKANQYYLRGFNLDHGTDFATSVMGMPVNMRTHGHGQGYSDTGFLIPELVDRMQYRKGPYAAAQGDFSATGSASIDYARKLDAAFGQVTAGEAGYRRGLAAASPAVGGGHLLYAAEWLENDGPWDLPQALGRFNGVLRYSEGTRDNGWSVAGMAYRARWTSTDQVPRRALDSGLIGRFGNLDPSDGGRTSRVSLSGEWSRRDARAWSRANAYVIDYDLNLWSNFTYCASDIAVNGNCDRGDQFEQEDRRHIYGAEAARTWYRDWNGMPVEATLGVQGRFDRIGAVGLYTTTEKQRWGTIRADQVDEGSLAIHGDAQVTWSDGFRSIAGLRADRYHFAVDSDTAANSGRVGDGIVSPKLSFIFGPWHKTEYYLNLGRGFHSNDARGVTARVNPDFRDTANFGAPVEGATPLVRVKAYEAGVRTAWLRGLQSTLSLWRLDSDSELLFIGDAGTTEPSFPSRRVGIEWTNYWTPAPGIIVDADIAWSRARFVDYDPTAIPGDRIPGALERTFSAGLSWAPAGPWSAGVRLRYFGPRPLVEDDSVLSPSSLLANLHLGYRLDKRTRVSVDVLNLFDRRASDIDYLYESQLAGEPAPVTDLHTHPAEPRTLRLGLRLDW